MRNRRSLLIVLGATALAPRAVFADWLSERGDPRGEFITIQLARHEGRATDAMRKREAALLKKQEK